jgi:hypothetical protein
MGVERIGCSVGARPGAVAIGVVVLGGTLDVLSTIVGHTAVPGVEEWNVVVLALTTWFSFPLAVVLLKLAALAFVAIGCFAVWRGGGRWELCLAGPGVVWAGVGLLNAVTILSAL